MFNPDNLRELFEKYRKENFDDIDVFFDAVENNDMGMPYECACSIGECVGNGEIFIINLDTGKYINWYKLTHVGRSASTNVDTEEELKAFFKEMGDTYKFSHTDDETWSKVAEYCNNDIIATKEVFEATQDE